MERQAKNNLLLFIEELESSVVSEEKIVCKRIKKDSFYSIYDVISSIREYVESTKYLLFDRLIESTYRQAINIKEFNEINDCLNKEFNSIEEFIDDNLPELYDKNATTFMEIYFYIESGLSSIYRIIMDL
ncbi:MAG: hypothetical protein MSH19_05030 [Methanobrevibacter smithii]|nr:hypothetical protein [Methanobrevibacter smithii]MCI7355457.1 hypothetical protein [Methanobrevibacter smithii]